MLTQINYPSNSTNSLNSTLANMHSSSLVNSSTNVNQPLQLINAEMDKRATNIGYGLGVFIHRVITSLYNVVHKMTSSYDYSKEKKELTIEIQEFQKKQPPVDHFVYTLDMFQLIGKKLDGITEGGLYQDNKGEKWLIKQFQHNSYSLGFNEYIASALLERFMPQNTAKTILVHDKKNNKLLIGSKMVANFKTFAELNIKFTEKQKCTAKSLNTNRSELFFHYNKKPIIHYHDVFMGTKFIFDVDAHNKNIGLVEEQDGYNVIKIDNGFTLNCREKILSQSCDYNFNNFAKHFSQNEQDLSCHGFETMVQAAEKIASVPLNELNDIINSKCSEISQYLLEYYLISSNPNDLYFYLKEYQADKLKFVKNRHDYFKNWAMELRYEHALMANDILTVDRMISQKMPLAIAPRYYEREHGFFQNILLNIGLTNEKAEDVAREHGHHQLADKIHQALLK